MLEAPQTSGEGLHLRYASYYVAAKRGLVDPCISPVLLGTHLSPECAVPFAVLLPVLLRPAMLRALPAPARAVRAVRAFVAMVSASATCIAPCDCCACLLIA